MNAPPRLRPVRPAAAVLVLVAVLALLLGTSGTGSAAPPTLTPTLPPAAAPGGLHYVALGDSFSSAEGAPYVPPELAATASAQDAPVDGWLDDSGADGCHRSLHAYGVRVWGALEQEDPGWGLSFRACSGATSEALWSGSRGEPRQFDAFAAENGGDADLVTLGIGGNDVGFAPIVQTCLTEAFLGRYDPALPWQHEPATCREQWEPRVEQSLAELPTRLAVVLAETRRHLAPGGRILLVGYPRVFPDALPRSCSTGLASSVGRDTMRWLDDEVVDPLNAVLAQAAADGGVSYVDTSRVLSTGGRHDACVDDGSDRWINRAIPSDRNLSFHPKFAYHEQVARLVLDCWHTCPPSRRD